MLNYNLIKFILISLLLVSIQSHAQTIKVEIPWIPNASILNETLGEKDMLHFENAVYDSKEIPSYVFKINNPKNMTLESISITNVKKSKLNNQEFKLNKSNKTELIANWNEGISKHQKITTVYIPGVIKNNKIESFEYVLNWKQSPQQKKKQASYPTVSKLSNGTWFKIKTTKKGVYRITGKELKDANLNLGTINSNSIRLIGQNNGVLPELNSIERPLGLQENAIKVVDGGDGILNDNDYILFYSSGPHKWKYNETKSAFIYDQNSYTDEANYFISFDSGTGLRIEKEPLIGSTSAIQVNSYDEYWVHEIENINIDNTGREWYGEKFDITDSYNFKIQAPDRIVTDSVFIELNSISNSTLNSSTSIEYNGQKILTQAIPRIVPANYTPKANGATPAYTDVLFNNKTIDFNVTYNNNGNFNAFGYLDYIFVNYRNQLTFNNDQKHFRDVRSWKIGGFAQFNYTSTNSDLYIWNITNQNDISEVYLGSNTFGASVDNLNEFIAFNPNNTLKINSISSINNQNLHGILSSDYILVYHPNFKEAAKELKEFHETYSKYNVAFVSTEEIYNEFSSGRQDITALRDFIKMIYFRMEPNGNSPIGVCLFGDASYDYKNYNNNLSSFVPTWEDPYSLSVYNSTATDDYLVCLDENEGDALERNELVDIGIGRFVINTNQQGLDMVNKIKAYKNRDNYGAWQTNIALVADDVDAGWERNLENDANNVIDDFKANFSNYNINKIYADAYQQTNSTGGQRYPEVEKAIDQAVLNGSLIVHYFGHGGEGGWATERILDLSDINGWSNLNNLPSFVTTTCEFTRYDDLTRVSAGELVHLNPNGGGISLFTSTRQLTSIDATALSKSFYKALDQRNTDGSHITMGEISLLTKIHAKIGSSNISNKRRFILIGDPGLILNYPEENIVITRLNQAILPSNTDTVKALSKVTIEGEIRDQSNNLLSDFNGISTIQFFDKKRINTTLNNDGIDIPTLDFEVQKNKIFKGDTDVKNGKFKLEFIVPKDIDLTIGKGRISTYAKSNTNDAWGADTTIYVGGIISNPSEDNIGPDIDLYMNDITFVTGGLTDNNPDIYAILKDSNGINAVGTGVGHDISAVLDAKSSNPIILNDFYKTFPNSYTRGEVRYNLSDIAEGEHTLSLRAWDNYNNSNTEEITFYVAKNEKMALNHVLNYPNPFTSYTDFQFEHNYENRTIEAQVQIFTISGKLVKTLNKEITHAESRVNGELIWYGLDDFGNSIGKGVYVYKLTVQLPESGKSAEKIEKLVIIK